MLVEIFKWLNTVLDQRYDPDVGICFEFLGKNPDAWQTSSGPPDAAPSRFFSAVWLSTLVSFMCLKL